MGPAPLATEPVTFAGPAGELKGSWSAAPTPKGAVLIVHENKGLTPHFVSLPGRLAASGYSALAVDLLSRKGGTGAFPDPAQATAALTGTPMADLVADLRAGVDELARRVSGHKAGVMGFCFGGGMVWSLLAAGEDRLAAAVPFYGPLPPSPDFSKAKAAVLAFYGETDAPRVNDGIEPAKAALAAAKLPHEVKVEPGAGHAFFNDTGRPVQRHRRGRRLRPAPRLVRPLPVMSRPMSDGVVLGLVALTLAVIVAGLFRLAAVLDSGGAHPAPPRRRGVGRPPLRGDRRRAGGRRRARRRQRPGRPRPAGRAEAQSSPEPSGAGPISLPQRPGPSPLSLTRTEVAAEPAFSAGQ